METYDISNKMLRSITFLIVFLISMHNVYGQISFYGKNVKPGTKEHFKIPITANNQTTFIPITVFCGTETGPTLGITAGVHGYEYPPIIAAQQLIKRINPKKLKGVIILVQIANLASFSERSPFINPLDKKNLNRMFPGDKEGSISEQIAAFITENVIARSDFFLDIHGGDASEDLYSYSAYYSNSNMPDVSEKAKEMAKSLLFSYVVVFNTNGKKYMLPEEPSLYCSAEAFKRGIPSVDIECGKLGKSDQGLVSKIEDGVFNMLKHLKMLDQRPIVHQNKSYTFIENRTWQSSNHDGIFYPTKQSGDHVEKGMKLGIITDYFGNTLETVYAEKSGIILIIVGTPPVNKGETIVVIGKI
ncbi:succinylglutamate desuccinylase/aspartoacylase family protein [Kordia sp.]|uniref:succinylglutamate desuccinylase/aspartoacylase family protein n=1 Tax=Kordia sp. TaxID=1965332 RepID=UPI003B594DC4